MAAGKLQIVNGKLLIVGGKLATSSDCCWCYEVASRSCGSCSTDTPQWFTLVFADVVKCTTGTDCPQDCVDEALGLLHSNDPAWEVEHYFESQTCWWGFSKAMTCTYSGLSTRVTSYLQIWNKCPEIWAWMMYYDPTPDVGWKGFGSLYHSTTLPGNGCACIDMDITEGNDTGPCDCTFPLFQVATGGTCRIRAGKAI